MTPSLRPSDAERDAAAERLRRGMGEGRLSVEELEERLEAAYRVADRQGLDRLVEDLPTAAQAPETPEAPGCVPVRVGADGTRLVLSIMGGGARKGYWRLAARARVVNVMGGGELDLTDVELAGAYVELTVFSLMGGSRITLPESLRVELSKFTFMGADDVDLGEGSTDPAGPVLHLRLVSVMGGSRVRRARRTGDRGRRRRLGGGPPSRPGSLGS